jgi:anti-anti-sigma regulatory factor
MSNPSASMKVSVSDQLVWVQISGRANFNASVDFKTLIEELRRRGHRHFVLDLTHCLHMDSTFSGVLARISMELADNPTGRVNGDCNCESMIELLNPNDRVAATLENLGVLHLFRIARGNRADGLKFEAVDCVAGETTKLEISRNCLQAHLTLMGLCPENVARFKDVAAFLAEDIKKLETHAQPA